MAKWVGRTVTDWEILIENDYQPEGVSLLWDNGDGEHGGGDAGQQGLIRRHKIYGTAIEEIWDDGNALRLVVVTC